MIALVGCGARKQLAACTAEQMYTGPYFRACLATALVIAPRPRVFILSARYGLLGLDDVIEPYDLTIGQPGAITAAELAGHVAERGIALEPVTALCGARYADMAGEVWPVLATPLAGLGIGRQRHVLAVMRGPGRDAACFPVAR